MPRLYLEWGTLSRVTSRRRSAELATAALEHGFSLRGRIGAPGLPGLLFRAGDRVTALDVVDALESGTPFLSGTLTGTYAADTSIPRTLAASFVAIPLPRPVPNIVLLGRGIGLLRLAGISLGGRQRLPLEGDFDRSFTLYCPAGYERDALYIFAPDLMALLVDSVGGGCDIELVDDWMLLYALPGRFDRADALDRIAAAVRGVRAKIERQTGAYRDDRVAGSAGLAGTAAIVSPDAHNAGARDRIAAGGRRVRTRTSPLQRAITVVSTLALIVAAVYVLLTQILPRLLH
jgi:hypothetical protein